MDFTDGFGRSLAFFTIGGAALADLVALAVPLTGEAGLAATAGFFRVEILGGEAAVVVGRALPVEFFIGADVATGEDGFFAGGVTTLDFAVLFVDELAEGPRVSGICGAGAESRSTPNNAAISSSARMRSDATPPFTIGRSEPAFAINSERSTPRRVKRRSGIASSLAPAP